MDTPATTSEAQQVERHTPHLYNLGPLSQIPAGEGRNFDIDGLQIAVFHTREGSLHALQSTCSHRGGPLADGLVGAGKVICPLHAYKFSLVSGEALGHSCPTLRTYSVGLNPVGEILLTIMHTEAVQSIL